MIANIETAIRALGDYEFVIDGDVNSQSDWDNNVRFVSGADENNIAIFTDTKPVTYAEVTAKLEELKSQYQQDETNKETKRASAKQKLQDLGLTAEEIKETFGL
jgi:vacuolar-type H+-ATPase subunit I/STV1